MNRKDRRAQAARERHGDTMGKSFTLGSQLPPSVTEHPAFKEGQRRSKSGEPLPPGYFQDIEDAARLIERWIAARATPPELRWLEWDGNRTFIAATLPDGARFLCDSPDAFTLIAWLDDATGRKLSLNQAGWALRKLGLMPMPSDFPGSAS